MREDTEDVKQHPGGGEEEDDDEEGLPVNGMMWVLLVLLLTRAQPGTLTQMRPDRSHPPWRALSGSLTAGEGGGWGKC